MSDCNLILRYTNTVDQLEELDYRVSVTNNGFYIHNTTGTIVCDTPTVEGLRGFLQAIQYTKEYAP